VLMADGTSKPISQVEVGDKVEATDPASGQNKAATVSHLFLNEDHDLADLVVRERNGATATLHSTAGHRVWDQTLKKWVTTRNLRIGDLLESKGGSSVVVEAIRSWHGSEAMYDLTVDGVHTFYVLAGAAASLLVHNCDWSLTGEDLQHVLDRHFPGPGLDSASSFASGEDPQALVAEAQAAGNMGIPTGNDMAYITQVERVVGALRNSTGGGPTTVFTTIVRIDGSVSTVFPGVPTWFSLG